MEFNWRDFNITKVPFKTLINTEFLADVKFLFNNDDIIFAHSFVLSLRSPTYYESFKDSFGVTKLIHVTDFSYELFLGFIRYLYTDEINLYPYNVGDFLKLSKMYAMEKLQEKCEATLRENISCETACLYLEMAIKEQMKDLENELYEYISDNYLKILNSESFLSVNGIILKSILSLDNVSDVNEFKIFESILKWTNKSCEYNDIILTGSNQRAVLEDNLKLIRFASMTPEEFTQIQNIAPGLLSIDEIGEIFLSIMTKKSNKLGYGMESRCKKSTKEEKIKFKFEGQIVLDGINFDYSLKRDDIITNDDTFYMEFQFSKYILLDRLEFELNGNDIEIQYKLIKYDKIIQIGQKKKLKILHNHSKRGSYLFIQPIVLDPISRYRIEYKISSRNPVDRVYYINDGIIIIPNQLVGIELIIYKNKSHIHGFRFKTETEN